MTDPGNPELCPGEDERPGRPRLRPWSYPSHLTRVLVRRNEIETAYGHGHMDNTNFYSEARSTIKNFTVTKLLCFTLFFVFLDFSSDVQSGSVMA